VNTRVIVVSSLPVAIVLAALLPLSCRAETSVASSVTAAATGAGGRGKAEPAAAEVQAAVAAVEKLHAVIIDSMKRARELGYSGRYERLQPVIDATFDMAFMAEKSAGRYWKEFDDEQKKRWIDVFGRLTIANYAGRFNAYADQHFETGATESAGFDTLLVRTRLIQPKDEDVEINYRLHEADGRWTVVDIYLSGTVSELALRRAEYGSVLQRDGFDKLIKKLEAKIVDLQNGSSG
jgi:phospholipid transport system substrate-binding protein